MRALLAQPACPGFEAGIALHLFERERQLAQPVRMLGDGPGQVGLLGDPEHVFGLNHQQERRRAREVAVHRQRQSRGERGERIGNAAASSG